MPLLVLLKFWPIIRWVLGVLGILGPEDKAKEEELKAKIVAAAASVKIEDDKTWVEFMRFTNPSPGSRVANFVTGVTALTRQIFVWTIALSFVVRKLQEVILDGAKGYANAGTIGAVLVSFVGWEFYGEKVIDIFTGGWTKIIAAKKGNGNGGNGNGVVTPSKPDLPDVGRISEAVPGRDER